MDFPPLLMRFTGFVFSPIATMAIIIKNLLISLNTKKIFGSTPILTLIVVTIEAIIKNSINIGKDFFKLKLDCLDEINDNANVIGIIAKVLVNLTVAALSSV